MGDDAVLDRYLCLSVDVQGYGTHDEVAQNEIQRVLVQMLDTAGARAGVDRSRWRRQPKGDEELALVPAGEMVQRVVGDFCLELDTVVHRHNLQAGRAGRLRLRLAIDEGPVQEAANGFVGQAVVGASRLVNSQAARQALQDELDANLVVLLSQGVYRDWVASGRGTLQRDQFRQTRVREKEIDEDAWLWVPGARSDRDPGVGDAVPAGTSSQAGDHPAGQQPTAGVEDGVRTAFQHAESHLTGSANVVNSGSVGGDINNAGRDVNSPKAVIGTGAVGGAAGITGAIAGVKAGGASSTTAAVGGGIGPKAIVTTLVIAGTTATVGGYAAYTHYTCSPLFGDRPAAQVLNTATHKFSDASFKFNFRAGGGLRMDGEFDNRKGVGQFHATSGSDSIDYVQDETAIYYRFSGGTWTREPISPTKEDPRIAQGNPIKAAEYLSSTGNTTQNHCSFQGTIDSAVLGLGSSASSPSLPFEASTNPDGYLTHLKIALPQDPGDLDWQIYDYGTKVTIVPPQTE